MAKTKRAADPEPAARAERPILMTGPLVSQSLAGLKTQTRRLLDLKWFAAIKFYDCEEERDAVVSYAATGHAGPGWYVHCSSYPEDGADFLGHCRYGQHPGDRLWVKETWGLHGYGDETDWFTGSIRGLDEGAVRSDWDLAHRADWGPNQEGAHWRPSIFMPRWACRLRLELTAEVWVERLQEITDEEIVAEGVTLEIASARSGVPASAIRDLRHAFQLGWDSINPDDPWDSNPWVFVLPFRSIDEA